MDSLLLFIQNSLHFYYNQLFFPMKVSEKKQGIQDSIVNMKSSPITKSQTKMTMKLNLR